MFLVLSHHAIVGRGVRPSETFSLGLEIDLRADVLRRSVSPKGGRAGPVAGPVAGLERMEKDPPAPRSWSGSWEDTWAQ